MTRGRGQAHSHASTAMTFNGGATGAARLWEPLYRLARLDPSEVW